MAMVLRLEVASCLWDARFWLVAVQMAVVTLAGLAALGVYRTMIRYVSFHLLPAVALAVSGSAALLYPLAHIQGVFLPRSVPVIFAALCLMLICGVRVTMRSILHRLDRKRKIPVIIWGAGAAGRQLCQALLHGQEYLPVAFVDDNRALQGVSIGGCRVFAPEETAALVARHGVSLSASIRVRWCCSKFPRSGCIGSRLNCAR